MLIFIHNAEKRERHHDRCIQPRNGKVEEFISFKKATVIG